jgi:hypothetical protein
LLTQRRQVAWNDGIRGALSRTTIPANKHEKLVFVSSDDVHLDHGVQRRGNPGAAAAIA